jgi:hypothetical protein
VGLETDGPVDEVRGPGQVAHEAAAVGEVRGRHLGDARLLAGPEGPEELLRGLAVEPPHVGGRADGVARAGLARIVREVADVTVVGDGAGGAPEDGVPEEAEDAQREDDHRLIARQRGPVGEVGPADILRRPVLEELVAPVEGAGDETRGADQRVALGLLDAFLDVGELGHGVLFLVRRGLAC